MSNFVSRRARPALFRWFAANAVFSFGFGTLFLIAPGAVSDAIGMPYTVAITVIGGVLAAFAAGLVFLVVRGSVVRGLAWAVIAADLGWMLGTVMLRLVMPGLLNPQGWQWAAAVAGAVFVFSLGQAASLRRDVPVRKQTA